MKEASARTDFEARTRVVHEAPCTHRAREPRFLGPCTVCARCERTTALGKQWLAKVHRGGTPQYLGLGNDRVRLLQVNSFPGSAWERTALEALPPGGSPIARQSLATTAFPGGAWEREPGNEFTRQCINCNSGNDSCTNFSNSG